MDQKDNSSKSSLQIPFLKWAGGKRWAVESIRALAKTIEGTYFEPFLGSGAVYFSLNPRKAVLSDLNCDLITTYAAIKDDWQKVSHHLAAHARRHSKLYYYEVRGKQLRTIHSRAAQFIYLNRTCWNGLYRVNLNGVFNVPIGTKTNVILESDDFQKLSETLSHADLLCTDFEAIVDRAGEGDLIFADPPYTVHHNHNGFVKYNENIFRWSDQERLAESLRRARSRGAKIILTNANHESIRRLYQEDFLLSVISRKSIIAAKSVARKKFDELLIVSP